MPWKVKVGEKSKFLDDYTVEELARIAARNTNSDVPLNWVNLTLSPGQSAGAAYDIVSAFAIETEQPLPERPVTARQTRAFIRDYFDMVEDDDLPTQVDEGGGPLEGESTTA